MNSPTPKVEFTTAGILGTGAATDIGFRRFMVGVAAAFCVLGLAIGSTEALADEHVSENSAVDIQISLSSPKTSVLVLGTNHFSGWSALQQEWLDPVVSLFVEWEPDIVLIERMPSWQVEMLRKQPTRFPGVLGRTHGPEIDNALAAQNSLNITLVEALDEIDNLLAEPDISAENRRRLALLNMAAFNSETARLHWSHLTDEQRLAGDVIDQDVANELNRMLKSRNETMWLALPIAKALGHGALVPFDDQLEKAVFLKDETIDRMVANGAIEQVLEDEVVIELNRIKAERRPASGEDIIEWFLFLNSPEYGRLDADGQWGSFLRADRDGHGRQRVALWEARNLRMVANVRELISREPGGRVLIIVGAAHKPWMDAYLDLLNDVEVTQLVDLVNGQTPKPLP